MMISESDLQVLQAMAAARQQHEELAELLDFYYDLYQVQFHAKVAMTEPSIRDDMAMQWRLQGGIPQLTLDQLGLEAEPFALLVAQVADVLLRHNPTWQVQPEHWQPEELLALAREVFEAWDTLTAPGSEARGEVSGSLPDHPRALAVGFALAPYLQRAAEVILCRLDLSSWGRGYCPVCGGRPNLALLEQERGARQLLCSRCNSLWSHQRIGCPFCGSKEKQTYYPGRDGVYRLYVCPACNHYLKTVDLRELYREVHPVVERLLTVGMDLAALQEGYGMCESPNSLEGGKE
jgi:FdhE protein